MCEKKGDAKQLLLPHLKRTLGGMEKKDDVNIFDITSQPNVNNLCCVCFFMMIIYLFTTLPVGS